MQLAKLSKNFQNRLSLDRPKTASTGTNVKENLEKCFEKLKRA